MTVPPPLKPTLFLIADDGRTKPPPRPVKVQVKSKKGKKQGQGHQGHQGTERPELPPNGEYMSLIRANYDKQKISSIVSFYY